MSALKFMENIFIKQLTNIQPVGIFALKIRYGRLLAGTGVSK